MGWALPDCHDSVQAMSVPGWRHSLTPVWPIAQGWPLHDAAADAKARGERRLIARHRPTPHQDQVQCRVGPGDARKGAEERCRVLVPGAMAHMQHVARRQVRQRVVVGVELR